MLQNSHRTMSLPISGQLYPCNKCGKIFLSEHSMHCHQRATQYSCTTRSKQTKKHSGSSSMSTCTGFGPSTKRGSSDSLVPAVNNLVNTGDNYPSASSTLRALAGYNCQTDGPFSYPSEQMLTGRSKISRRALDSETRKVDVVQSHGSYHRVNSLSSIANTKFSSNVSHTNEQNGHLQHVPNTPNTWKHNLKAAQSYGSYHGVNSPSSIANTRFPVNTQASEFRRGNAWRSAEFNNVSHTNARLPVNSQTKDFQTDNTIGVICGTNIESDDPKRNAIGAECQQRLRTRQAAPYRHVFQKYVGTNEQNGYLGHVPDTSNTSKDDVDEASGKRNEHHPNEQSGHSESQEIDSEMGMMHLDIQRILKSPNLAKEINTNWILDGNDIEFCYALMAEKIIVERWMNSIDLDDESVVSDSHKIITVPDNHEVITVSDSQEVITLE